MDENFGSFHKSGQIIIGFDLVDIVDYMAKTNRKYQATLLAQLEEIVTNQDEYKQIRKLVLDSTNNYLRTIVRTIYGGIEV